MKLIKMKINGFRSYGEEVIVEFNGLTTFIGDNGAGKTAVLIMLNKIFIRL